MMLSWVLKAVKSWGSTERLAQNNSSTRVFFWFIYKDFTNFILWNHWVTSLKLERSINEYEHETNHAQKRKVGKDENSQIVNISPKSRKVEAENGFEIESPNMASMLNKSFQSSPLDRKSKAKNSRWIITCDRCSFETHKMDEFQSHIHDLHSDLNDFKCSQCPFSTTSSTFLNTHRYVKF